jgi:hypothetical protein
VAEILLEMQRSYPQAQDAVVKRILESSLYIGPMLGLGHVCDDRRQVPFTCLYAEYYAIWYYCRWNKEGYITAVEEMSRQPEAERGAALVRLCEDNRLAESYQMSGQSPSSLLEIPPAVTSAFLYIADAVYLGVTEFTGTYLTSMNVFFMHILELEYSDDMETLQFLSTLLQLLTLLLIIIVVR